MPPQAIFNNCQNNELVPASGMKFSHKHKRNLSRFQQKHGINYFADLRMTFRQNFCLQDWFRNKFGVGLG
jgi:hypothetical protein